MLIARVLQADGSAKPWVRASAATVKLVAIHGPFKVP